MKFVVTALFAAASLAASTPVPSIDTAAALYRDQKYPEARAALEQIVAADPKNAAACYYLGMTLSRRGDTKALDDALPWMEKAIALEPGNARYLADYGGTCLELADKHTSLSFALKGRDAMEKAIKMNPSDLDARDGLMQFYAKAPWPLGSSSKARAQADEMRKVDPQRGLQAIFYLLRDEKKYTEIMALCENVLKTEPDNYLALYELGRTASLSGEKMDRGIAALEHALSLAPGNAYAPPSNVQYRLGLLYEKKGDRTRARTAYEAALKLDPANKNASTALDRVK